MVDSSSIISGETITALAASAIQAAFDTNLTPSGIGTFTVSHTGPGIGNFVIINDSITSFNTSTDAVIEVASFTGLADTNFVSPF